jgi:4-amino-4-deoxy-L-arabinose transferase-like glycosyltransferase
VLAANTFLIFLIFWSLSKVWTKRAALLTVFFIATCQFLIAHSMLVTMDAMAGYMTMLGLVWFGIWIRRFLGLSVGSQKKSAVISSLFIAGALVSKSSAILLIPFLVLVATIYLVLSWKKLAGKRVRYILSVAAIMVMVFGFVTLWYTWHVRNMSGEDVVAQLQTSYPIDRYPLVGLELLNNVARTTIVGRAFAEYAHGMLIVNSRINDGNFSFFFNGHYYSAGVSEPLYFPGLYFAKQQIAYHLLGLLALGLTIYAAARKGLRKSYSTIIANPEAILVSSYTIIFMAIVMHSTLQIGLRHALPVVLGAAILTGLGTDFALTKSAGKLRYIKPVVLVLCAAIVFSTLLAYPYYISYYNALTGGTSNGYKIAVDSNYDWGQDIKLLEKWRQENKVDKLYIDLHINPFIPVHYYLGGQTEWYKIEEKGKLPSSGSYIAISAEIYQKNKYKDLPDAQRYSKLENHQVGRVGTSIFIFRVP